MSGNSLGKIFKVTTFGESHGAGIGAVIDGVRPGIALGVEDIQLQLDRRKPGQSSVTTPRKESDKVEILSGVFEGKTTGAPIGLLIRNSDAKSQDYNELKDLFRPGHADLTYQMKYGLRDWRGSGRSSGRETAMRVAAGAIAQKILDEYNIKITAYTLAIGGVYAEDIDLEQIENNIVRCPDLKQAEKMIEKIEEAKTKNDSLGGIIEAVIEGCPPGVGEPVFEKLEARLTSAVMSVGAIKAVEIGSGFLVSKMMGSESNDTFQSDGNMIYMKTNHAGGILGGISTGDGIVLRVAVKPPSSIAQPQETVNIAGEPTTVEIKGRHDPCICPRVVPVVEAMLAVTLLDSIMIQESIRGTSLKK